MFGHRTLRQQFFTTGPISEYSGTWASEGIIFAQVQSSAVSPTRFPDKSSIPGRHFDEMARFYDATRRGYPAALFDDIFDYAGSPALQRALEIGCGTGQATRSVAARGISILCLEPGVHLAELAEQNLAEFRHVQIDRSSFEEWTLEQEAY